MADSLTNKTPEKYRRLVGAASIPRFYMTSKINELRFMIWRLASAQAPHAVHRPSHDSNG